MRDPRDRTDGSNDTLKAMTRSPTALTKLYVRFSALLITGGAVVLLAGRSVGIPWYVGLIMLGGALLNIVMAWREQRKGGPHDRNWETMDLALNLRSSDPVSADRLLDDLYAAEGERGQAELERLRQASVFDRRAALQLRERLEAQIDAIASRRRVVEHRMSSDPRLPLVLQNMERAQADTRELLKEVESCLLRLSSR